MKPILIDVATACQALSIGKTKAYDLIKDGTLKTVKLGRARRILLESVEAISIDRTPDICGQDFIGELAEEKIALYSHDTAQFGCSDNNSNVLERSDSSNSVRNFSKSPRGRGEN